MTAQHLRDAPSDHGDEPRELGRGWRGGGDEVRAAGAIGRKDTVGYERMEMHVEIDRTPEALNRGDGAGLAGNDAVAARPAAVEAPERTDVNREDGAAERVVPREHVAQPKREAQHPLSDRHGRQYVIDEVGGALGHAAATAARAHGARLARERHEPLGVAGVAAKAGEASGPHATSEELVELTLDERRHAAGGCGGSEERGEVRAHDAMEHRVLGAVGVPRHADGRFRCHPLPLSRPRAARNAYK